MARLGEGGQTTSAVRHALMTGGIDGSRVDLVYDGVTRPSVSRRRNWRTECQWPEDSVVCGIVGAMSAEKGVAILSEIRERLSEPSRSRLRLVLLGGKRELTQSIGGFTTFCAGFVDEIHDAMAGLDILLHPSSAEGLGTAVIDAVALGGVSRGWSA